MPTGIIEDGTGQEALRPVSTDGKQIHSIKCITLELILQEDGSYNLDIYDLLNEAKDRDIVPVVSVVDKSVSSDRNYIAIYVSYYEHYISISYIEPSITSSASTIYNVVIYNDGRYEKTSTPSQSVDKNYVDSADNAIKNRIDVLATLGFSGDVIYSVNDNMNSFISMLQSDGTQALKSFPTKEMVGNHYIIEVVLKSQVEQNETIQSKDYPLLIAGKQYTNMTSGNVLPTYYSKNITVNPNLGNLTAKGTVGAQNIAGVNLYVLDSTNSSIRFEVGDVIQSIQYIIPSEASQNNKLADRDYVNNQISTYSGNYISDNGEPFNSLSDLESYSGTVHNNDYAIVIESDGQGGINYVRYKYNSSTSSWGREYVINATTFSQSQWNSINSGITSNLVSKLVQLNTQEQTNLTLSGKVDKETGKVLSSNDYTTQEKNKLASVENEAQKNVRSDWNATSGDAQILNKPENIVSDPNYVHTDNNYTTVEKQNLATVVQNYVPQSRTINSKQLSSDILLTLEDIYDGTTRKLDNYFEKSGGTVDGDIACENINVSQNVSCEQITCENVNIGSGQISEIDDKININEDININGSISIKSSNYSPVIINNDNSRLGVNKEIYANGGISLPDNVSMKKGNNYMVESNINSLKIKIVNSESEIEGDNNTLYIVKQ